MPEIQVRKSIATQLIALLFAAVLGGLVAAGTVVLLDDDTAPAAATTTVVTNSTRPTSAGLSAGDIYKNSQSAVVEIQAGNATGTGFVIDEEGHLVTNNHVVGDSQTVSIRFADESEEQGRVIGTDPSTDIALVQVDLTGHDVTPVKLGSSADVEVGDPVYAIGNPFGLERSLTAGIVSAVDRDITAPNHFTINDVIQTDAPVNPGNSGGPLLDASGNVIGVVSQIQSENGGNIGIGYAVPSDTVRNVVGTLKSGSEVEHAYLGVRLQETDNGVSLSAVLAGEPGQKAGMQTDDVVLEADGEKIESASDIQRAVDAHKPGDKLVLKVRRGGDERTVTVTLGTRPPAAE
ncbi:MAG TPA: trypsin-like peptidase domain-containing protein [Gaiellaceae bacterium]|nr:trypsin-like peptidase domain-containing protein [Gaiellaceae bacterium]